MAASPEQDNRPGTYQSVNAALRKIGAAEKLVKGDGYCYFIDGDAHGWPAQSVYVYRMSDLTVAQWIAEYRSLKAAYEQRVG